MITTPRFVGYKAAGFALDGGFWGVTPHKTGGMCRGGLYLGAQREKGCGAPQGGFGISLRWGRGLEGAQLELWRRQAGFGILGGGATWRLQGPTARLGVRRGLGGPSQVGNVLGEPWRPQDVDLGFPGWGWATGSGVSQALGPPGDWDDPVLRFPGLLTGAAAGDSQPGV